jgi:hypothetical protein
VPKMFGLVVSFFVSLVLIQVAADVLHLRVLSFRSVGWASPQAFPKDPIHEVDRDASAGALFT